MSQSPDPRDRCPGGTGAAIDKPSTHHKHPAPAGEGAAGVAALAGRSLAALLELAALEPQDIVVVGCSTSEIRGTRIGSAGSPELADLVIRQLIRVADEHQVELAIQCCEHLNRALVVERRTLRRHGLTPVTVWPRWNAGGALAAAAMAVFEDPAVVESVAAGAGIDIGHTLIGMHLRPVAVPVRLPWKKIGEADLVLARTRPRLIGGARACYSREESEVRWAEEAPARPGEAGDTGHGQA